LLATRSTGLVCTSLTISIPEAYFSTLKIEADFFYEVLERTLHTAMNHFSLDVYVLAVLIDCKLLYS
jgi:hypothetical protein